MALAKGDTQMTPYRTPSQSRLAKSPLLATYTIEAPAPGLAAELTRAAARNGRRPDDPTVLRDIRVEDRSYAMAAGWAERARVMQSSADAAERLPEPMRSTIRTGSLRAAEEAREQIAIIDALRRAI